MPELKTPSALRLSRPRVHRSDKTGHFPENRTWYRSKASGVRTRSWLPPGKSRQLEWGGHGSGSAAFPPRGKTALMSNLSQRIAKIFRSTPDDMVKSGTESLSLPNVTLHSINPDVVIPGGLVQILHDWYKTGYRSSRFGDTARRD